MDRFNIAMSVGYTVSEQTKTITAVDPLFIKSDNGEFVKYKDAMNEIKYLKSIIEELSHADAPMCPDCELGSQGPCTLKRKGEFCGNYQYYLALSSWNDFEE